MSDDCVDSDCQILKPHTHRGNGVFFAWQRQIAELEKERDELKEAIGEYQAVYQIHLKERDQLRAEKETFYKEYRESYDEEVRGLIAKLRGDLKLAVETLGMIDHVGMNEPYDRIIREALAKLQNSGGSEG